MSSPKPRPFSFLRKRQKPSNSTRFDREKMQEKLHKSVDRVEKSLQETFSVLEQEFLRTKARLAKIKIRVWQLILIITILFYVIGLTCTGIGTFSSLYRIQNVHFTSQISYDRAHNYLDLRFNNVSILPYTLEVIPIQGYLITPINPKTIPLPAIVWVHGMVVNSEINLANALEFAAAGYKVLAISNVGHGSTGGLWDFGLAEPQIVWAAVEYLTEQPDVDVSKIAVVGHSNGGLAVTRAALFDKTPFGTGGKIKAVGSLWGFTDLNDSLLDGIGTNVIDDPTWGTILATFFGCKDGVISTEDVKRRSVIEFINETNVPNYYLMTGDKDSLTNLTMQFRLFEKATGGLFSQEYLESIYDLTPNFDINNTQYAQISFLNGTARQLSILHGQDHVEEVMIGENMEKMIDWITRSLGLPYENHLPRSITRGVDLTSLYRLRINGIAFVLIATILLVFTLGFYFSGKFFPSDATCVPQFIPLKKENSIDKFKNIPQICDENGNVYQIDYIGDPIKFITSWKKKLFFMGIIFGSFLLGIALSWYVKEYYFNFWIMDLYIWQYFLTGLFLFVAAIMVFILGKRKKINAQKIDRHHLGITWNGFVRSMLFVGSITAITLGVHDILALIFKFPAIFPRPLSWRLVIQVICAFWMIFLFYFSLEVISKSQLFDTHYTYPSWKGYLQEILINGTIIWILWIISYLVGGIFMNSHLKWLFLQHNTGSGVIESVGILMFGMQGIMAYTSAIIYQQTRNIFSVAVLEAIFITLVMTGKFAFIYSV